ncbi:hypothetical protein SAMN04488109_3074 [Chryseolinea serpens]|uniref:Uncharacterized protein n=1 Tax=Chryseolinea serpens TaxID=947013 RepID=A0A1M5QXF3_9BACT|nr:hypothetical protein [Chryseolinea serpens]SHH18792.1 hypothetical protein SAMN04488109_3074 [Chryseolinea serpens]
MQPFQETLKKYLDTFSRQEMYFLSDNRNLELFQNIPSNTKAEDILTKISAINDPDVSNHGIINDMVAHILKLAIDERLKKGDLSLVEAIATANFQGKPYHLLHFASVYCNFHRPDVFPIYSEQHLEFYKQYIKTNQLPLDPEKLDTYDVFSKVLNDLIKRLGLTGKMNYLHIRKFGWLYAENVLKESSDR